MSEESNKGWSDEELENSIQAYSNMQKRLDAGQHVVKKRYYEDLADLHGRSAKAFEYRMQNISSVIANMGLKWIKGLPPAKHVGANVEDRIVKIIRTRGYFCDALAAPTADIHELEKRASEIRIRGILSQPAGSKSPIRATLSSDRFIRDPGVVAWVLENAGGTCECCGQSAPFSRATDGSAYLEVHHVRTLAEGGNDTVDNAVAVCPNCHRELHLGIDSEKLVSTLYARISRLTL